MKKNCRVVEIFMVMILVILALIVVVKGLDGNRTDTVPSPTEQTTETIDISTEPVVTEVVAEEPEEGERNTYPQLWTDKDAVVLAQMLWGEARGVGDLTLSDGRVVSADAQMAACIWTVLNRYDADYENSIVEVVTAPGQYYGYSASHPVDEELLGLTYDVLTRWNCEQYGETDVGRVLPSDYYWFKGDGEHNWFTNVYRSTNYWDWQYEDIYAWNLGGE